jgi:uncharacterized protein (DUF488 family)
MMLYTIGFTKKSAARFFDSLCAAGVQRIVDVRLNNVSQLAGFAKRDDLAYFLEKIGSIQYEHMQLLAPTQEMLDAYKKEKGDWGEYERRFLALMEARKIESVLRDEFRDGDCFLCSEEKPDRCHRRLVIDYLVSHNFDIAVKHLG